MTGVALLLFCAGPAAFLGVDAHGIPLPTGAARRLGPTAWRADLVGSGGSLLVRATPDGRHVVASSHGVSMMWEMTGGRAVPIPNRSRGPLGMAYSEDGKSLLAVGPETYPEVHPVRPARPGESVFRLGVRQGGCVILAPGGRFGASWSGEEGDGRINLFEAKSGSKSMVIDAGAETAGLAFLPAGRKVAVIGERGGVSLFDTVTGKRLREMPARGMPAFRSARPAVSPDGRALVARRDEGLIRWDLEAGHATARSGESGVPAYSPEGRQLACVTPRAILLLNPLTLRTERVLAMHRGGPAFDAAFSADGRRIVVGYASRVAVFDAQTGRLDAPGGHGAPVRCLAFSADAARLASGDWTGKAIVWDILSGKEVACFAGHNQRVSALAFSPDGMTLAVGESGFDPARVTLWDIASGRRRLTFIAHPSLVSSAAWSPDGRLLLTGGDGGLRCWDAATGRLLGAWRGVGERILGFDGPARAIVFDAAKVLEVGLPAGPAKTLAVRVDDRFELDRESLLPTLSSDRSGLLFSAGSKRVFVPISQLRGAVSPPALPWETGSRRTISPSGDFIAARPVLGGGVHLTSSAGGTHLGDRDHGITPLTLAQFSPDGRWLAAAGLDSTILLWDVDANGWALLAAGWLRGSTPAKAANVEIIARRIGADLLAVTRAERRVRALIPDLGSDDFDTRQRAAAGIDAIGPTAALGIRCLFNEANDLEVKARLKAAWGRLDTEERERWGAAERLAPLIRALARMPSHEARKMLRTLATFDETFIGREAARVAKEGR